MKAVEQVIEYLEQHKLKLATAESCTAGTIIALLSDVSGSGSWLEAGYVVYSPGAKQRLLGVTPYCMETFGLTSVEVAQAMALGALRDSPAGAAVATTGVAGPEPMDGIAPGTVCFAWAFSGADGQAVYSRTEHFPGERSQVRESAALHALVNIPRLHQRFLAGDIEQARPECADTAPPDPAA